MKFSIAAGILTQALPAISETSPSKLLEQEVSNDHDLPLARAFKSMWNVGDSHGREMNSYQSVQNLYGLLENIPFANKMKACDPSSNDPDVGILSCDAGYECVSDQDSTGGHCSSVSRDLQDADICYLCGDGSEMGYENFLLPIPVAEGAFCGVFAILAYSSAPVEGMDIPLNATECSFVSSVVQSAGCCTPAFDCNPCGDGELLSDAMYYESDGFAIDCGLIVGAWNETACSLYGPDAVPICCAGSTSTTSGSVVPTPVPVGDSPSGTDAPAPEPSASEDKWSTKVLVSMMSLTVVTAGTLLLN